MIVDRIDAKSELERAVVRREVSPPAHVQLAPVIRLLDALNCGAVLLERGGRIVHVNARICAMMGRSRGEVVGRNVLSIYEADEARGYIAPALAAFDTPSEGEFYIPLPGGATLPVIISARVISGDRPLRDYAVVTLIDLSKQKTAELDLREQYNIIAGLSNTVLEQAMALKHSNELLEHRVAERTAELHAAHMEAMYMLAIAAEAKDDDTGSHVRRLERYTLLLAGRMGFSAGEAQSMGHAAILHDIGKIHVPDHVLKKPGPLTVDERQLMQEHTLTGERILAPSPFFARARRIARGHHENWDGSGYPDGVAGDRVPVEARIVHVVDVFDALTSPRVYKPAWSEAAAVATIDEGRGKLFDPDIVRAFRSLHDEGAFDRVRIAPESA